MSLSRDELDAIRERVEAEEWRWDHHSQEEADCAALLDEVDRLRAGIEALVTRYRAAWDEDGDTEAHAYAEDLLNLLDPTEGETDE